MMTVTVNANTDLTFFKSLLLNSKAKINIRGILHFTKTHPKYENIIILRDDALISAVYDCYMTPEFLADIETNAAKMNDGIGFSLINFRNPTHVPVRVISEEERLGFDENVFLFFPYGLTATDDPILDQFGLELVDKSWHIFEANILPRTSRLWSYEITKSNFQKTIYFFSLLHEIGHQLGTFNLKFTKKFLEANKSEKFLINTIEEIHADVVACYFAREHIEVTFVTIMMRIFWYLKRDPLKNDHDGCGAIWFWNVLKKNGFIENNKIIQNPEKIKSLPECLFSELSKIGEIFADGSAKAVLNLYAHLGIDREKNKYTIPNDLLEILK